MATRFAFRRRMELARWFQRPPVLPGYTKRRAPAETFVKKAGFLALCVFLGLFYGLAFTILPPQLSLYLSGPMLVLALLIIWALPDVGRGPVRLLAKLLMTYLVVLIMWPNYLALQLPGLPWISLRRLIMFPMSLIFMICLSVSHRFRSELAEVLRAVKPLTYMMIGFTAIQILTIALSAVPFFSLNVTANYLFGTTSAFFIGAWLLAQPRYANWFINTLLFTAFLLCIMAVLEYRNQAVLWANHIPPFLQVQDEAVLRTLTGASRDGRYRVTGPFTVSLCMAEYFALVTPFIIHRIVTNTRLDRIVWWMAFDLFLLQAINLTQSRLGVLGWILAHVFYGCIWGFRRWNQTKADIIGPAVSLIYTAGATIFVAGMFTIPAIRNRTIGGGTSGFSDQGRRDQFALMWPKLFKNPFGYGGGRSGDVLGFRTPSGQLTVDSYIISVLLDYGVIGGLMFFGLLAYAAAKMLQIAWNTADDQAQMALPAACAILVALQVRSALSQTDNLPLIYITLGLVAGIAYAAQQRRFNSPVGAAEVIAKSSD